MQPSALRHWLPILLVAALFGGCNDSDGTGPGTADLAPEVTSDAADTSASSETDTAVGPDADVDTGADNLGPARPDLWSTHASDPAAAARGLAWLTTDPLVAGIVPPLALRHLYLTWPINLLDQLAYFQNEAKYRTDFHTRYGTFEAPFDNGGRPVGIRMGSAGLLYFDCLMCHAGPVGPANTVTIGAPNNRLNLERLYDDLQALPAAVEVLRNTTLPEPYATLIANAPLPEEVPQIPEMAGRTLAPGHTDAVGLGLALSAGAAQAGINTSYGAQDPGAWWTLRYKDKVYTDGSGQIGGYRAMMATLQAYGPVTLGADAAFDDIAEYLLSLEAPAAQLAAPDPALVAQGEGVYVANCASCHGGLAYPSALIDDVGTEAFRASQFGPAEASHINSLTGGGEHAMTATNAYLAPPLLSVWATPPYFHNGSVPDLVGVLNSAERPANWQATGGYDAVRIGLTWEVATDPEESVDTSVQGLGNAGHVYGDALTPSERTAVIAYLVTL